MPARHHPEVADDAGIVPLDEAMEELGEGKAAEVQDISPEEWLESDESNVIGHATIVVNGAERRLAIAALTEDEVQNLIRAAKRPGPNGRPRTDLELSKRLQIAYSLNKAAGKLGPNGQPLPGAITHVQLGRRLSGRLTALYMRITELSGFTTQGDDVDRAAAFFD